MDILTLVKTTNALAATTKAVLKTATEETQTEMTWPNCSKQLKKCTVDRQTTKVNKPCALFQTRVSQNDTIKLKISQSKVYLTKQQKGSNDNEMIVDE